MTIDELYNELVPRYSVGRMGDKSFPITYHATEDEAVSRIELIKLTDPTGVFNGDYFIDEHGIEES